MSHIAVTATMLALVATIAANSDHASKPFVDVHHAPILADRGGGRFSEDLEKYSTYNLNILKSEPILASTHFQGIDPASIEEFSKGRPFTCNISESVTITLNHDKINDDYCDCLDGRDEPGAID